MKQIIIILFVALSFGCSSPQAPINNEKESRNAKVAVDLIVECEKFDNKISCDTFFVPDNFIKHRYTKIPPAEMSSHIYGAWDDNSYRLIDVSETSDTNYFYYEKVEVE